MKTVKTKHGSVKLSNKEHATLKKYFSSIEGGKTFLPCDHVCDKCPVAIRNDVQFKNAGCLELLKRLFPRTHLKLCLCTHSICPRRGTPESVAEKALKEIQQAFQ